MSGADLIKNLQQGSVDLGAKFGSPPPQRAPQPQPEGVDAEGESSVPEAGVPEDSPSSQEKPSSDDSRKESSPENLKEKSQKRFQELANAKKSLESELAAAREELQKLREQTSLSELLKSLKQQPKPENYDDWSDEDRSAYAAYHAAKSRLDQTLPPEKQRELGMLVLKDRILDMLPDTTRQQAAVMADLVYEFGEKMTMEEVAAVAARRHPELFAQQSANGESKAQAKASSFKAQRAGSRPQESLSDSEKEERRILDLLNENPNMSTPDRLRLSARVNTLRRMRRS